MLREGDDMKALQGVKVLDFSRVLAGPYCTLLLADMGAEVIKVEKPGSGDDTRLFGPYQNGESGYFALLNRGKQSIEADLKDPEDIAFITELIKEADVIVENFRPGVMERVGFGYDKVKELNPGIVYASISGFGQYGPYRERPAYDLVAQAMGGMTSITGHPENPPTRTGSSLGDMSAALYAAYGIMVALFHKQRTGEGQYIDVAMVDTIFAMLETNVLRYTMQNEVPGRIGSRHPISTPFDIYKVQDGYLVIAIANNPLFEKFCHALGMPELITDERFSTDSLRTDNEMALKHIIETHFAKKTVAQAEALLAHHGIPCSKINTIQDIVEDEHTAVREMLVDVEHPIAGTMKLVGNPVKFKGTPAVVNAPPPKLGEHTTQLKQRYLQNR